jgi:hypothetical protein
LIKIAYQALLYKSGFISVSADEFARGITAFKWSENPHAIYIGGTPWMPLETYLNGFMLMLWDNVILAPRFTAFLASCLLLVYFYKFTKYIFSENIIAYFAVLMLLFHQWYVWLSGTPMLDIYFLAFILGGLYYLAVWLEEFSERCLLLSALFLFISSAFHFQSWAIINVINLVTFPILLNFLKNKDFRKSLLLITFYFANNFFILIFTVGTYLSKDTLNVFRFHTVWSKIWAKGYNVSLLNKLLYYPILVAKNGLGVWWLLLLIAMILLLFKERNKTRLTIFLILPVWLGILSIFNIWSVPAQAAPGRFCLFFVILSIPYVAYAFYIIFQWDNMYLSPQKFPCTRHIRTFSVFMIAIILSINVSRSLSYPQPSVAAKDIIETGKFLNTLLNEDPSRAESKFMVESILWTSVGIQLTSKHPENMVLDRKRDFWHLHRRVPSMFLVNDPPMIKKFFIENNVRYILLRSKDLKETLESRYLLPKKKDVGAWTIYEVDKTS